MKKDIRKKNGFAKIVVIETKTAKADYFYKKLLGWRYYKDVSMFFLLRMMISMNYCLNYMAYVSGVRIRKIKLIGKIKLR